MFLSVENFCSIPVEKLPFTMFGLCLQEPMGLLTNWLIALTAFYFYIRIKMPTTLFQKHWKLFYLFFGISTFFGGLGHLLFNYFDVYGKFPCWFFGVISAYHAGKAMISIHLISFKLQRRLTFFLLIKGLILLMLAVIKTSFLFIMVDATITYLLFCLGFGIYYWQKGLTSFKYTVYAVLILFPSIFVFSLQLNPHLWFNKNDLSHVLMVTTIIFFYFGIVNFKDIESKAISLKKENKRCQKTTQLT